jgi:glycosyltransferase involved in cell wall biosynthesis
MNRAPQLSVVVIGRNEGARLARCLASVHAGMAAAAGYELIYVDSGSDDGSGALAAAQGATLVCLDHARPSAALARNAGWRLARGALVLFLDGDTVLAPGFLAAALAAMAEPQVAVVWGHRRELWPQQSRYVRVLDLDWVYAPGDTLFCGGDALMRRAPLAAVGGFDAALIAGEEPELCSRLRAAGALIRHIDVPMTGHDLAIVSFAAYWRRAFRAGYAYADVAWRCRARGEPLWRAEVRRNAWRGAALLAAAPLAALALAAAPAAAPCLVLAAGALLARGMARCRWKGGDAPTRLLYVLHAYFQHLPICCGQLACMLDRWRGRRRGLIEYRRT